MGDGSDISREGEKIEITWTHVRDLALYGESEGELKARVADFVREEV